MHGQVGGLISERLKHPKLWMMRLALWFLSTWIGSFILCGRASLSSQFPYFQSFPQMSQQKREEILLSWSLSFFYLLRMLFKTMKLLTLLVFFTQVPSNIPIILISFYFLIFYIYILTTLMHAEGELRCK